MMQEEQQQASIFENSPLNETDKALLQISRWTRLISVIGFGIGASVVMVMLFYGAQILKSMAATMGVAGLYPVLVAVFFIMFFMASMVLYYMYKASRLLAQGVLQKDKALLSQAFVYLKNFFIVVIIFAVFQLAGNLINFL